MNTLFIAGIIFGAMTAMAAAMVLTPFIIDPDSIPRLGKITYLIGCIVGIVIGAAFFFLVYNHVNQKPNP